MDKEICQSRIHNEDSPGIVTDDGAPDSFEKLSLPLDHEQSRPDDDYNEIKCGTFDVFRCESCNTVLPKAFQYNSCLCGPCDVKKKLEKTSLWKRFINFWLVK